jgi:hypothetical protein
MMANTERNNVGSTAADSPVVDDELVPVLAVGEEIVERDGFVLFRSQLSEVSPSASCAPPV